MDIISNLAVLLYILFFVGCGIALLYLIIRRIDLKDKEDFEKRDN